MSKSAVCVLIINKLNKLKFLSVSLKEDHTDFNLPGGTVIKGETYIEAAIREIKEETGYRLPNSDRRIESFNYKNHTVIYKVVSGQKFSRFIPTSETDYLALPKLSTIIDGSFQRRIGPIKSYVLRSFKEMYLKRFI